MKSARRSTRKSAHSRLRFEKSDIPGIVETVPTYRSLLVHYHPEVIGFKALTEKFDKLMGSLSSIPIPPPTVIEIPVLYGGEMGPDIENVAEHNHKTVEEVIKIHTSEEYLIYMIGFIAGFPYLGGMSKEIATPRLKSPRVKIEAAPLVLPVSRPVSTGSISGRLAVNWTDSVKTL